MRRDELIELGARSLFGGRFHSSQLGEQASVMRAVEALGPTAAADSEAKARRPLEHAPNLTPDPKPSRSPTLTPIRPLPLSRRAACSIMPKRARGCS